MTPTAAPAGGRLILQLPSLIAGRDLADRLLDRLSDSYEGRSVVVDATRTSTASPSFAGQLVQRILVEVPTATLTLAGAPREMTDAAEDAAASAGVGDRLHLWTRMPSRHSEIPPSQ